MASFVYARTGYVTGDGHGKAPRFGREERDRAPFAAAIVKALRASSASLRPFG